MSRNTGKNKHSEPNIDFWKSSSDMMTALILVLLLVIMFLVLYILQLPDAEFTNYDENKYEQLQEEDGDGDNRDDDMSDHDDEGYHDNNNNGGGGDDGDGDDEGDYPSEGDGKKSAVKVSLVDAETQKAIPEKGVTFELYSDSNALMVLNTYYPKKKSYRKFKTAKDGTFYLPEKILETKYYLHQLTDLKGYDLTDKTEFAIDGPYDWPDPFLVKVPLYPKRDTIRIQMTDKEDGQAVAGGQFEVIAAENIVTSDDTIRVKAGERADIIVCDEKGYGESKRLYLGKYKVKQSEIPEYYASTPGALDVTLEEMDEKEKEQKKAPIGEEKDITAENPINTIRSERTKITFVLTDELEGTTIPGAEFEVSGPNISETMTTDENGEITLDQVMKNSTYEFAQNSAPGDYIASVEPIKVDVSNKGRIGKEAQADVIATNRLLRLDIGVRDAILRSHLVDIKAELFTEGGKSVKAWTTNGAYAEITGLPEGKYYVNLNGDKSKKYPVAVTNTAQVQEYNIRIFTMKSYAAIGGAAVLIVAALVALAAIIRRRRKRRLPAHPMQPAEQEAPEETPEE